MILCISMKLVNGEEGEILNDHAPASELLTYIDVMSARNISFSLWVVDRDVKEEII
jgi:hypothetical protein